MTLTDSGIHDCLASLIHETYRVIVVVATFAVILCLVTRGVARLGLWRDNFLAWSICDTLHLGHVVLVIATDSFSPCTEATIGLYMRHQNINPGVCQA